MGQKVATLGYSRGWALGVGPPTGLMCPSPGAGMEATRGWGADLAQDPAPRCSWG